MKVGYFMDRRIQKTKNAIKTAYMALLIEKKTSKITIAEIARKANIDRKTFYLHYESTESIIKEITEEKMNDFLVILEKNGFFESSYDTYIYFQSMNQLLEQDIEIFQRIVKHPDFNYFWQQIETIMVQTLTEHLSEIVNLDKEELTIYTIFLGAGINDIYTKWLKKEIPVSLEELGHIVNNVAYYGAQKFLPHNAFTPKHCDL